MNQYVYMMLSKDEYELPIAIADTVSELAQIVGVKPSQISSTINKAEHRGTRKPRFIRVQITNDDSASKGKQRGVVMIDNNGKRKNFPSILAGAKFVNGNASCIYSCCAGKPGCKTYKGYRWEFIK